MQKKFKVYCKWEVGGWATVYSKNKEGAVKVANALRGTTVKDEDYIEDSWDVVVETIEEIGPEEERKEKQKIYDRHLGGIVKELNEFIEEFEHDWEREALKDALQRTMTTLYK